MEGDGDRRRRWLEDGATVTVGEQTLEVIHCPGHTPGHVVFLHRQAQLAWVGDVIFAGSIGRTDFPMGNHEQLIHSIREKLFPIGDDIRFVPGMARIQLSVASGRLIRLWRILNTAD